MWIGPGAVVAGGITVGQDAVIGANTVVTRPVPARSAVLGHPAEPRTGRGGFGMVVYRGSEDDPGRTRSLEDLSAGPVPVPVQPTGPGSSCTQP